MAQASDSLWSWSRQDIINSAGDADALGRTVRKFLDEPTAPETLKIAVSTMLKLNEMVPSEVTKQFEEVGRILKSKGIK